MGQILLKCAWRDGEESRFDFNPNIYARAHAHTLTHTPPPGGPKWPPALPAPRTSAPFPTNCSPGFLLIVPGVGRARESLSRRPAGPGPPGCCRGDQLAGGAPGRGPSPGAREKESGVAGAGGQGDRAKKAQGWWGPKSPWSAPPGASERPSGGPVPLQGSQLPKARAPGVGGATAPSIRAAAEQLGGGVGGALGWSAARAPSYEAHLLLRGAAGMAPRRRWDRPPPLRGSTFLRGPPQDPGD